ncbi:Hypothetical predicted protein, partial [Mytilus galloprovincialis]
MATEKTFRVSSVEYDKPTKSNNIDWANCILCQEIIDEKLICPFGSKRLNVGAGYQSLADNIKKFHALRLMPEGINVCIENLDEGSGIAQSFIDHKACWHKSCNLKLNRTKLNRAEKRTSRESIDEATTSQKKTRHSFSVQSTSNPSVCFFCNENGQEALHESSTFGQDTRVRECAVKLNDTLLLAKLSAGDLIAQEAKYHSKCLVSLYNRASRIEMKNDNVESKKERQIHGIAFSELVSYINETRSCDETISVYKLSDLCKLYTERITCLGADVSSRVNSSRLKDRIVSNFPDLDAYKQGRENILAFKDDIGPALKRVCLEDFDNEFVNISKAATFVRKDIFASNSEFKGTFPKGCQEASVPQSLLSLISMIQFGPNIQDRSYSQSTLTIAQLLMYSCTKKQSNRHMKDHEPPVCAYLGVMIHCKTRKRDLVDTFFKLGLSVSYDRVLEISTSMANDACRRYVQEGIVCPTNLLQNVFTSSAVDNIDHNPSSISSKDSFHGTGISLFQHISEDAQGVVQALDQSETMLKCQSKRVSLLPESYSNLPPAVLRFNEPDIPLVEGELSIDMFSFPAALKGEFKWLKHVAENSSVRATVGTNISWSAYHAAVLPDGNKLPAVSALLPLFHEQAKSVAMIRHSLNIIRSAVRKLNPGQTPVVAFDQPLFTVAKLIQWNWPQIYGEDHFVMMFGGLHIEMAAFKALGSWLEDSGWTSVLVNAQVTSPGTADSFLKASHVTKTRRAHQVTACTLYRLLSNAYCQYKDVLRDDEVTLEFEDWCLERSKESPHFKFCYQKRTQKPTEHSLRGNFVVNKTEKKFSCMAIDQAHEQNNACVKADGGAVGLTENPGALRRWMVAGPEMARLVNEFENVTECFVNTNASNKLHHEQTLSFQESFRNDIVSLYDVIDDLGNPFLETSKDLLVLDSKNIVDISVVKTVNTIESLGQEQFEKYTKERLVDRTTSVFDTIKRNKLPLFQTPPPAKKTSTTDHKLMALKSNCSLFSRLYIACQSRDGNLDDFFRHENHAFPPSLSQNGTIRLGTKADLLSKCLERLTPPTDVKPVVSSVILDGSAVVNMLKPVNIKSFNEYALKVFIPYIQNIGKDVQRIDIVFDTYIDNSLKASTRGKRGKGIRRRVQDETNVPGNWQEFLRLDENKIELFHFLADKITSAGIDNEIV